jgi:hypothetical protein
MLLSGAKFKLLAIGVLCAPLAGWAQTTSPAVITFVQSPTSLSIPGWSLGSQDGGSLTLSTSTAQNYNGEPGSLVASYPSSPSSGGAVYVWGAYSVAALKTEDIYVEFWAKMPAAKQGLKFLKIFGASSTSGNYANTTFALDYTGGDPGSMYQVSFGDGSTGGNDTGNVINFDGSYPSWIGRSYGTANVQTPQKKSFASAQWGTSWHHFRIHAKFNSGTSAQTEVANGAYSVEIDGNVYVNASGLFNRNYTNGPIDRVELFGWSQNASSPFQIWYDDVRITTGGFASGSTGSTSGGSTSTAITPEPPANVSVQ